MSCSVLNANILNVICLSRISFVSLSFYSQESQGNCFNSVLFNFQGTLCPLSGQLIYYITSSSSCQALFLFFLKSFLSLFSPGFAAITKSALPSCFLLFSLAPLEECLYIISRYSGFVNNQKYLNKIRLFSLLNVTMHKTVNNATEIRY